MKKNLLFVALLAGAMSASAQTELCMFDNSNGVISDGVTVSGGTVVGKSDNVTMKIAYDDSYKTTSVKFQGYNVVNINGTAIEVVDGFTGSTNPAGQSLGDGVSTAANAGCVIQFDVTKDGYLTVIGKLSSNKEYYVWEGDATYAMPVAYTLAMDWSSSLEPRKDLSIGLPTLVYTLPADDMGYLDFSAADIDKYVNGAKLYYPEKIVLGADYGDVKTNGLGVITFPVYADAGTYLVHAAGSKVSTCGAVFTTEPVTSLSLSGADEDTGAALSINLIGDPTAISGVTANAEKADVNAPVYNLAGQQVSKAYKGVVIQNGKKFIQK